MSRMYSREDLDTRVKNVIQNLSDNEKNKQIEMAESFGTNLYSLVYTQICHSLRKQKTSNGYSRNKTK